VPESSEVQLVGRLKSGDKRARTELWEAYVEGVRKHASGLARQSAHVDDIVSETYLRALKSIGSFNGDCKLSTWLHRLTSNAAFDYYRSKARDQSKVKRLGSLNPAVHSPRIPEELVVSEERERLRKHLSEMSDDHREVISLRRIAGKSVAEAAKIIGRTEGAVKMLYLRANLALVRRLNADPYFADWRGSRGRSLS